MSKISSMLFLSAGVAGAALVVLGVAVAASTLAFPLTAAKLDLGSGQATFDERCAVCHAAELGQTPKFGPSLAAIGEVGALRVDELSAPEYILQSIIDPSAYIDEDAEGRMPSGTASGLQAEDLLDLIAWLSSKGAEPDYKTILAMDIEAQPDNGPTKDEVIDVASAQRGWQLFSKELGCSGCHRVFGAPGSEHLAPTLTGVSLMTDDYLLESWRDPSAYIHPGYVYMTVELTDGSSVAGRLLSSSAVQTVLVALNPDTGGLERRVLSASQIVSAERESQSRMPAYSLSPADERSLLDFLHFLSGGV